MARKRNLISLREFALNLVLMMLAAISLFPFWMMLITSAKDSAQIYTRFWKLPSPFRFENFSFAFEATVRYIVNSGVVSIGICVLTIIVASLAAYAFSVLEFRGKNFLFMLVLGLMMVPGVLTFVPLYLTVRDVGLLNSYLGLILPQVTGALPFATILLRYFFDKMPGDIISACRIDGVNEWQILRHIVAPLSMPIISTLAVLNILGSWNNYVWPLVVVRDEALRTIPLGLAFLYTEHNLGFYPGKQMASYVVASIPLMVSFFFAMRTFMRGLTSGALKV